MDTIVEGQVTPLLPTPESKPADIPEPVEAKADTPPRSIAKLQGVIGIVAITIGNIAGIITHVEQIRQFVFRMMGTEWAYRFHDYIVAGASALLLFGNDTHTYRY